MGLINNTGKTPKNITVPIPISGAVPNTPTSTTLGANKSFSTDWFDARGFISIFYVMFSDVTGSLMIEYSNKADGSNILASPVMVQYDSAFVTRGIPRTGSFPPRADYVRMTYTNGGTAQTMFNFLANLLTTQAQSSLETLLDQLTDTRLASIAKSVLQAKDSANGSYDFVYRFNNALRVYIDNPTSVDVSLLSKDTTLKDGSQKTQITNFPTSTEIANDTGNPIPVSGSVSITNLPTTQPISGSVSVSNFPASTEIANDVGNPIPVTGNVTVSNPVTTVGVNNFPTTQAVVTNQTTTGGYPTKGYYQPSGTGGGFALIASGVRKIGGLTISNTNTSAITVMLFDKSIAPTSGDTAVQAYVLPANFSLSVAVGAGIQFNNGIGIGAAVGANLLSLVTLLTTAITAGSITVNYWYI